MLFEDLYESLVHRHRIPKPIAQEEGLLIMSRLHELLDGDEGEAKDTTSHGASPEVQCPPRDSRSAWNGSV